jgi:hypothetical protein
MFGRMRLVVGITPRGPTRSFTHLLNRHVSSTFSIRGIGIGEGIGRGFNMLSHHDTLRVTCPIILRGDGALHPFTALSLDTLFNFVALLCFNTSKFCALGDPSSAATPSGAINGILVMLIQLPSSKKEGWTGSLMGW